MQSLLSLLFPDSADHIGARPAIGRILDFRVYPCGKRKKELVPEGLRSGVIVIGGQSATVVVDPQTPASSFLPIT